MKEMVEFAYVFTNDNGDDEKRVFIRKNGEGVRVDVLCEAFVDFMEAAGFSVDNIYDYFEE